MELQRTSPLRGGCAHASVSTGPLDLGLAHFFWSGEFPISRLRSMAQCFQHKYPKIRDPLNKIYIKTLNVNEDKGTDRRDADEEMT